MGRVAGQEFEQDLSKESGSRRAILEEKTEESAVRTIESKGFLQTSPLPLGYRALFLSKNFQRYLIVLATAYVLQPQTIWAKLGKESCRFRLPLFDHPHRLREYTRGWSQLSRDRGGPDAHPSEHSVHP